MDQLGIMVVALFCENDEQNPELELYSSIYQNILEEPDSKGVTRANQIGARPGAELLYQSDSLINAISKRIFVY